MPDKHPLSRLLHSDWTLVVYAVLAAVWYNLGQIWTRDLTRWLSMALVVAFTVWLVWRWHLTRRELGLERQRLGNGLRWGGAAVAIIAAGLGLVYLIHPATFIDSRYHVGWGTALVTMFLAIPLRTVLFEELLFRGLLLVGLQRVLRLRWAVLLSSLAFGFWHIEPSLYLSGSSESLRQAAGHESTLAAIIVSVISTSFAGAVFCWLKLRSHSLLAPVLAHWAINALSVGLVVAAYARLH